MDKPRILVVYYSQSGQLREIIDSVLSEVREHVQVTYAPIEPLTPWPFPWKASTFFDAMPESVVQKPAPVKQFPESIINRHYDLIILGWQPWFLHPSQPVTAFLQGADASVLKGKPVVTVVGSRNMWLNAGEKIKEDLKRVGAVQVGNIVLTDTNPNLVSLLTIIRWAFSGKKEASKWLPAAGVQQKDVLEARRFGKPILEAAQAMKSHGPVDNSAAIPAQTLNLHQRIMMQDAIKLNTGLVLLEQRGVKNFRYWAKFIREKGGPGDPARKGRVTLFKRLLLTAIFILSPISSATAAIQRMLQQKRLRRDVEYFKGLEFEPGRI